MAISRWFVYKLSIYQVIITFKFLHRLHEITFLRHVLWKTKWTLLLILFYFESVCYISRLTKMFLSSKFISWWSHHVKTCSQRLEYNYFWWVRRTIGTHVCGVWSAIAMLFIHFNRYTLQETWFHYKEVWCMHTRPHTSSWPSVIKSSSRSIAFQQ